MKEVFGPASGFQILDGPPDVQGHRLWAYIDHTGLDIKIVKGFRDIKLNCSLDQVAASVENGNLVLALSGQRYVLKAKAPEKLIQKIEDVKEQARLKREQAEQKAEERRRKEAMMCSVCKRPKANNICVQCGEKVCPEHSNIFQGQVYCVRCKVVCPKCRSDQISAHKRGFKLGRAVAGTLVGGVILGGLIGAIGSGNVELMCHTCGHRWQPHL